MRGLLGVLWLIVYSCVTTYMATMWVITHDPNYGICFVGLALSFQIARTQ